MNSLTILAALFAFVIFGYLSHVRILSKHFANHNGENAISLRSSLNFNTAKHSIELLGLGTFIAYLPCLSLMLFWGWGPALIWLIVAHLLLETSANFLFNLKVLKQSPNNTEAKASLRAKTLSWQLARLALSISLVAILAKLIVNQLNQNSGQIFLLAACIAILYAYKASTSGFVKILQVIVFIIVILLSYGFSQHLGLTVFGNWQPLSTASLDWLNFNNSTLLAMVLVAGFAYLTRPRPLKRNITVSDENPKNNQGNNNSALTIPALARRLITLSGTLLVVLLLALIWQLVIHQPLLDAPLHSTQFQTDTLPFFLSLCLLFGFALIAALTQILASEVHGLQSGKFSQSSTSRFISFQQHGLLLLILSICLLLVLASATGIGAWNSHYIDWSGTNLIDLHYQLSVSALAEISGAGKFADNSLMRQLFALSLNLVYLSALSFWLHQLSTTTQQLNRHIPTGTFSSQQPLLYFAAVTACILVCFVFIANGLSINHWLLIGSLAWFMIGSLACKKVSLIPLSSIFAKLLAGFVLAFVGLGLIQLLYLVASSISRGGFGFAAVITTILIVSIAQWYGSITHLIKKMAAVSENTSLFENK